MLLRRVAEEQLELREQRQTTRPGVRSMVAADRRIILLTVFRKQRMREDAEVQRAWRAMQRCVAEAHALPSCSSSGCSTKTCPGRLRSTAPR
jgi:hypothetical protein